MDGKVERREGGSVLGGKLEKRKNKLGREGDSV